MQIICEATQSENSNIKVSALQNLVKIMNLYYEFMEAYMGQALFAVSKRGLFCFFMNFILLKISIQFIKWYYILLWENFNYP